MLLQSISLLGRQNVEVRADFALLGPTEQRVGIDAGVVCIRVIISRRLTFLCITQSLRLNVLNTAILTHLANFLLEGHLLEKSLYTLLYGQ